MSEASDGHPDDQRRQKDAARYRNHLVLQQYERSVEKHKERNGGQAGLEEYERSVEKDEEPNDRQTELVEWA